MSASSTHVVGSASLLLAAFACWRVAGSPWRGLAVVLAAMAAIIATQATWLLHHAVGGWLRDQQLYQQRGTVQLALFGAVAAAGIVFAAVLIRRHRGRGRVAVLATLALAALFAVEPVSLHAVDRVISRPVGPVHTIALLWAAAAAVIGGAALAERRARRRR